jgi:hypothetical protein
MRVVPGLPHPPVPGLTVPGVVPGPGWQLSPPGTQGLIGENDGTSEFEKHFLMQSFYMNVDVAFNLPVTARAHAVSPDQVSGRPRTRGGERAVGR